MFWLRSLPEGERRLTTACRRHPQAGAADAERQAAIEGTRLRSADSRHSAATRKYPECSHPLVGVRPAGRRTMARLPFVAEVIQ